MFCLCICLSTYLKTAFVSGIVLAGLNLLICTIGDTESIITGLVGCLISGILIIGTHHRNSDVILAWMILAIFDLIANIFWMINAYIIHVFFIVCFISKILSSIWILIVANKARREIGESGYEQL